MKQNRKGIILAGGTGTRLHPITLGVSKHLLPVFDKPMVYYPISILMLTGIRKIALITTPESSFQYKNLLGDGSQWGCSFSYIEQASPDGLAQAYLLAENFLNGDPSAMILGDNFFYGHDLPRLLMSANDQSEGSTIFTYHVDDPTKYGVVELGSDEQPISVVEKPNEPPSSLAISGMYFFDGSASSRAATLTPSERGEYEITSLIESYLYDKKLNAIALGRGHTWLDLGTHNNLLDAGNFVRILTERQGVLIGSPDEIAYNQGWITSSDLKKRALLHGSSSYGYFLSKICTTT